MDTVLEIKQKLDIVDVISSYVSLKKSGKNYKGICPFHSEKTPSFMVTPELQIYKCFGCGESGDIFTFIQKIEGVEFIDALNQLADRAGVEIKSIKIDPNKNKKSKILEINDLTAKFYSHLLTKHIVGRNGLDYLKKKRKLNDKTIEAFRLGYAQDNWTTLQKFLDKKGFTIQDMFLAGVVTKGRTGYIDKFRGRIMFPLIDISGRVLGFTGRDVVGRDPKYLNTTETLVFHKSDYLYGLDKARVSMKKGGAILVEGQMDVIQGFQEGIDNVVASSGTSLTKAHLRIISRYTNEIILCFDPDSAGISAAERALKLSRPFGLDVKVAIIPDGYADLDNLIVNNSTLVNSVISTPVPIYDFYLATALRKFDKNKAYGKKKILNYLSPILAEISEGVVFDHYVKKLSEEIGVLEETVRDSIKKGKPISEEDINLTTHAVSSFERHYFIVLFKAPIDTIGQFLYKLESGDFENKQFEQLHRKLLEYVDSNSGKFDIKLFVEGLDESLKNLVSELYLSDLDEINSNERRFETEMKAILHRIKKSAMKRELKKITDKIKLSELEGNTEEVIKLTKQFTLLASKPYQDI